MLIGVQEITMHVATAWARIFKPGAPGFLELLLSANVCMRVCVRPRGYY